LSGTALAAIVLGLLLAIVLAVGAWIKWRYSAQSNGTHLHHKGNDVPSYAMTETDAGVPLKSPQNTTNNPLHAGQGEEEEDDRIGI
jgi:hypothetical protein